MPVLLDTFFSSLMINFYEMISDASAGSSLFSSNHSFIKNYIKYLLHAWHHSRDVECIILVNQTAIVPSLPELS